MSLDPLERSDAERRLDEILASYMEAEEAGRPPDPRELLRNHPEFAAQLAQFFANQEQFDRLAVPLRAVAQAACGEATTTPRPDGTIEATAATSPGKARSFGPYELLQEIGRGGMGLVYKAQQKNPHRLVALKMIRTGQWRPPPTYSVFATKQMPPPGWIIRTSCRSMKSASTTAGITSA